jgi:hypothetical protein
MYQCWTGVSSLLSNIQVSFELHSRKSWFGGITAPFCNRPEDAEWLNSRPAYACCLVLPICGLLPLVDKTGYGLVNNIWCAALIDTEPGKNWLIVCYIFIFATMAVTIAIFVVIAVKLRVVADLGILWKVLYGVGGYVAITMVIWIPRVILLKQTSNESYLAIRLLPDVAAVLYAILYFWRRGELYQFEEDSANTIPISAQLSIRFISRASSGGITDISSRGSDMRMISTNLSKAVSNPLASAGNTRNHSAAASTSSPALRDSDTGIGINSARLVYEL